MLLSLSPSTLAHFPIRLRPAFFAAMSASSAAVPTVDHIVLFKLSPAAGPAAGTEMTAALRALSSLPGVVHLSASPIHRRASSAAEALGFTHCLHSRYGSKANLAAYAAHPSHLKVVKELVLPKCEDIMAVDWVFESGALLPAPTDGAAARLVLAKVKAGVKSEEVSAAFAGGDGVENGLLQASFGENFSPARAKGYTFGSLSVFSTFDEIDRVLSPEAAKVDEFFEEDVIAVDFTVTTEAAHAASSTGPASL